jgi:tetratricopeptide (TPR) repeat protein
MVPTHRVDKYIELAEWLAFSCANAPLGFEWIEKAIAHEPDNAEALAIKGDILQQLERYEEALICYDRVLEMVPEAVDAAAEKAQALCSLERWQDAIETADDALESIALREEEFELGFWQPTEEVLYDAKAHAIYELGNRELAIAILEEALARYPDSETLKEPLRQLLSETE